MNLRMTTNMSKKAWGFYGYINLLLCRLPHILFSYQKIVGEAPSVVYINKTHIITLLPIRFWKKINHVY
jgi:hypothetical protein